MRFNLVSQAIYIQCQYHDSIGKRVVQKRLCSVMRAAFRDSIKVQISDKQKLMLNNKIKSQFYVKTASKTFQPNQDFFSTILKVRISQMRNYTTSESGGMRCLNTDGPLQRSYNYRVGAECPWSCTNVGQASMAGVTVWRKCCCCCCC